MKIRGNLFGGYTGKLGLNYGRYVHGINLGAMMPTERKSSTSEQKDQQLRFGALGALASAFLTSIREGLKVVAKTIGPLVSEFDAFVKINRDAVTCIGGAVEVDYGNITIADGHLPQVGFATADFEVPLTVKVPYTGNADVEGADTSDKVYLVVLEPESGMTVKSNPAQRSAGSIEAQLPSTWSGLNVHVYGYVVGAGRDNKGQIARSAYIGTGEVA